jgi:drug/metabolite transporter (DMT)-like permease
MLLIMKKTSLPWILLIALSLVWGSSFILMKRGLTAFDSDEVAALRITIASVFLLPLLVKYHKIDLRKNLKGLVLMGVFGNLIPAFLFTKAETEISSSLTGMLNALTPLFTILIGIVFFKQTITKVKFFGVTIGFLGAIGLIVFGDSHEQSKNVMYCLLVVAATICYAISVNGIRAYLSDIHSITATVWAFTLMGPIAAIYLFGFTDVVKHTAESPYGASALGYVSILAIFGTAISVVVFNYLIKMSGAIFAASCTYLIPVVAIGWGLFDGEVVNPLQIAAVFVIIGGIWLINTLKKD